MSASASEAQGLLDLAADLVAKARALGADEVSVGVSASSDVQLSRRDGKVEEAKEARTRRVGVRLLVDDRYSSHSTSDLRPEALEAFLARAVEASRYLEPDADRRLPPADDCGRGSAEAHLDHLAPAHAAFTAEDRAAWALAVEQAILALRDDRFISATAYTADGHGLHAQATSHGFADTTESAWYGAGGMLTLRDEGDRRPEGFSWFGARYRTDLPTVEAIAAEADRRAREAIGAAPAPSGTYPMILANHAAGRILGLLSGPLGGYALHHGRSCLADKLDAAIASEALTLRDDPTIPRGLASTPWDGDLRRAVPRTIVERGVLRSFYIDQFHARRLGRAPTTGGRTNWVVEPGAEPWEAVAKRFPKAILVTGFLGGNANGTTGDFSYGIRGQLLEHGEPVQPLAEMNVSGNLLTLFPKLLAVGTDVWTHSPVRSPTLVFDDVSFSGT